jgi:hypothetical protein
MTQRYISLMLEVLVCLVRFIIIDIAKIKKKYRVENLDRLGTNQNPVFDVEKKLANQIA